MALGTLFGGWRIVRTMGSRITRLTPMQGFCAETGGRQTLFLATWLGVPVSTTHTITGAIVGVGAARRLSAVRWNVTDGIVFAWVVTIPAAGIVAALFYENWRRCSRGEGTPSTRATDHDAFSLVSPFVNRSSGSFRLHNLPRSLSSQLLRRVEVVRLQPRFSQRERGVERLQLHRVLGIGNGFADDPEVRNAALAEGDALLAEGSISRNQLQFRRDAIDACLQAGDWGRAEAYAAELEDYARAEPMPWTDHIVARGRALAAHGAWTERQCVRN